MNYFETIDTPEKAYFLGRVTKSKVTGNTIKITAEKGDFFIMKRLFDQVTNNIDGKFSVNLTNNNDLIIESKEFIDASLKQLKTFDTIDDRLKCDFIRAVFEANGSVNTPEGNKYPKVTLRLNSTGLLDKIVTFLGIPFKKSLEDKTEINYYHNNALDFLGKLYDNKPTIFQNERFKTFLNWAAYTPNVSGEELYFKFAKTRPDAVAPFKERVSDSGYDLTCIEKIKEKVIVQPLSQESIDQLVEELELSKENKELLLKFLGKTGLKMELWETGIQVQPDYGYYFRMVPRSSSSSTGYIMANLEGTIDRTYTGSIKVALIKIDPNVPDIEGPFRYAQIIPTQIIHVNWKEDKEIAESSRGDKGFGSTVVR